MEKIIQSQNYDYSLLLKSIDSLCQRYPFLDKMSIGKSIRGRDIAALKIGNTDKYSLFCAAFHGSEHITTNISLMWLEDICDAVKNRTPFCGIKLNKALSERGIIIVPRVNPDGCEISINDASACGERLKEIRRMCNGDFLHYNANFRGVDINHNFDAGWEELKIREAQNGIHFPCSTRFGGYKKMSEPETAALAHLCKTISISHATALHSQGRVIYWSYGHKTPKNSKLMVEIMAQKSGYSLDVASGIAEGGGFKDWFINEFCRPAFTVEVGEGTNPLPIHSAKDVYSEVKEMLTINAVM